MKNLTDRQLAMLIVSPPDTSDRCFDQQLTTRLDHQMAACFDRHLATLFSHHLAALQNHQLCNLSCRPVATGSTPMFAGL